MSRFTGIPELPPDLGEWEYRTLTAIKQNLELLTGTRGELDGASKALVRSDVTVVPPTAVQFQALAARGAGVSISGVAVPSLDDYTILLQDVIRLSQDVTVLRATVSTLIGQLRGS
jgi:hypothetical protein